MSQLPRYAGLVTFDVTTLKALYLDRAEGRMPAAAVTGSRPRSRPPKPSPAAFAGGRIVPRRMTRTITAHVNKGKIHSFGKYINKASNWQIVAHL